MRNFFNKPKPSPPPVSTGGQFAGFGSSSGAAPKKKADSPVQQRKGVVVPSLGELVCNDDSLREEKPTKSNGFRTVRVASTHSWGKPVAVVVALDTQSQKAALEVWDTQHEPCEQSSEQQGHIRVPMRTLWFPMQQLKPYHVQQSDFPILDLPLAVLGNVFYFLTIREGARAALTCKKMLAAFKDETTWKRRAINAMGAEDALVSYRKTSSWMETFRGFRWTIVINTMFHSRGGCSISSKFQVEVSPTTTVAEFIRFLDSHPKNPQAGPWARRDSGMDKYKPFSESHLYRYNHPDYTRVVAKPDAKPNCSFNVPKTTEEAERMTIREAGLCDGAILEQPETMMCD